MSSNLLNPLPEEPGYYYGSVLPLRAKEDANGKVVGPPELAVPGIVRGAVNNVANLLFGPGEALKGNISPENVTDVGIKAGLGLAGLGAGVDTALGPENALGIARGYHGTSGKFDQFSNEKIGSGEGNQSYGWGHYVSERPEVATTYRNRLTPGNGGNVYKVDILADPEKMLDWEKTLAEQPDNVKKALDGLPQDLKDRIGELAENRNWNSPFEAPEDFTGGQLVKMAQHWDVTDHPQELSEALANGGVPGIRYLDQQSRKNGKAYGEAQKELNELLRRENNLQETAKGQTARGEDTSWLADRMQQISDRKEELGKIPPPAEAPTRNYVIFNPNDLKITGGQ